MQNTTRPPVVVLESINPELLFQVSGGCGKKCPPPAPAPAAAAAPVMQVLQMPSLPQPQPIQQQALPPQPSGPEVSTSVSINGQVQG